MGKAKTAAFLSLALNIILAVCLIASLENEKSADVPEPAISSDVKETYIGKALGDKLGEISNADGYNRIYDYIKEKYNYNYGVMPLNDLVVATEDIAKEEAVAENETAASGSVANTGTSSTNVMTAGVDESDISVTDGDYIYNATESEIIIFDIRGEETNEINRFTPDFSAPSDIVREIFIDGDTMTVLTDHAEFNDNGQIEKTITLTYDISDRKNVKLIGKYSQDGSFYTARKVGDIVYLFTNSIIRKPTDRKSLAISPEGIKDWFITINEKVISPECIFLSKEGTNAFVMSSYNQNNPSETIDIKVIINDYTETYVGAKGIYLYSYTYSAGRQILKISKLDYDNGDFIPGAATSIRGEINDKFAINEYDGYLRIVATEWNDNTTNTLYVFDKDLVECGRIANIAPGERLYACRFMGDMGYFVTFEQTDPLYSVDLSDPNDPKLVGEVKLPGFSEYLHYWGNDKLLGIGYDADSSGRVRGLKLSMFDISDASNIIEESKLNIKGDYAPGFYNYKAILAYEDGNVLGFSYVDYSNDKAYYDFYRYTDSGFTLYKQVEIDSSVANKARGHVANEKIYVAKDDLVLDIKKETNEK